MRPHLQVPARRPSSCTPLGVHLWDGAFDTLSAATKHRLWLSLLLAGVLIVGRLVVAAVLRSAVGTRHRRGVFWSRQALSLGTLAAVALIVAAVWFNGSASLGTFSGFLAAGLAFALQKVVTAFAGYLVILRGETFTVGDRITMGGVRGDVIDLGFLQTRIMEMGESFAAQSSDNPSWVHARQYTGRVVTVTNDKVFDQPIYNYTREFPYMWEELQIPVYYGSDRRRAEAILVDSAREVTAAVREASLGAQKKFSEKYAIDLDPLEPRVYYNLTDNYIELHLRFLTPVHGVRAIKDGVQRNILDGFEAAGLKIASTSMDISNLPPLRLAAAKP
jgi:small-conductance mechanosensitive channel